MIRKRSFVQETTTYEFVLTPDNKQAFDEFCNLRRADQDGLAWYMFSNMDDKGNLIYSVTVSSKHEDRFQPQLLALSGDREIEEVVDGSPEEQEAVTRRQAQADLDAQFDSLPPEIQKMLIATGVVRR